MKKEELARFIELRDEVKLLVLEIFDYVKLNYKEFLQYRHYSCFESFDLDESGLYIKYYDARDFHNLFGALPEIPFDVLENESLWKKFIDEYYILEQ